MESWHAFTRVCFYRMRRTEACRYERHIGRHVSFFTHAALEILNRRGRLHVYEWQSGGLRVVPSGMANRMWRPHTKVDMGRCLLYDVNIEGRRFRRVRFNCSQFVAAALGLAAPWSCVTADVLYWRVLRHGGEPREIAWLLYPRAGQHGADVRPQQAARRADGAVGPVVGGAQVRQAPRHGVQPGRRAR